MALPETVTIKTSEYLDLLVSDLWLTGLANAGVDNWEGYDEVDRGAIEASVAEVKAKLTEGGAA